MNMQCSCCNSVDQAGAQLALAPKRVWIRSALDHLDLVETARDLQGFFLCQGFKIFIKEQLPG